MDPSNLKGTTVDPYGCDHGGPESLPKILAWCRDYFERRVNFYLADQRRCLPPHIIIDFGNRGLMGLVSERGMGGLELSTADAMRVIEYVAAVDQSLAVALVIQNFLAGNAVRHYGSATLRGAALEDIARGRLLISFALTEGAAGSDPRRITTRAVRQGDENWVLSGSKIWAGLAAWSGAIVTFARTDDPRVSGAGYTAFFVPQSLPGVRQGEECLTMGLRGIVQNRIHFDGVQLSPQYVLGSVGEGLKVAQESMMLCRVAMGALSLGAMRRALQYAFTYATRRTIATGRMIDNPVMADFLVDEVMKTRVAESYLEHLYWLLDTGGRLPDEYLLACKVVLPEWMWQTVDRTLQIVGGRGYDEANGLSRLFRDARIIRIFEGATEVMAAHLGGKVMLDPGAFSDLLRSDLGSAGIADEWNGAVAAISGLTARKDGGRRQHLRDRFRLGLLAAYALVAAVNEFRLAGVPGDSTQPMAAYAREAFSMQLRNFHAKSSACVACRWSEFESVEGLFAGLPGLGSESFGEDTRIDPYLAATWQMGTRAGGLTSDNEGDHPR